MGSEAPSDEPLSRAGWLCPEKAHMAPLALVCSGAKGEGEVLMGTKLLVANYRRNHTAAKG